MNPIEYEATPWHWSSLASAAAGLVFAALGAFVGWIVFTDPTAHILARLALGLLVGAPASLAGIWLLLATLDRFRRGRFTIRIDVDGVAYGDESLAWSDIRRVRTRHGGSAGGFWIMLQRSSGSTISLPDRRFTRAETQQIEERHADAAAATDGSTD